MTLQIIVFFYAIMYVCESIKAMNIINLSNVIALYNQSSDQASESCIIYSNGKTISDM